VEGSDVLRTARILLWLLFIDAFFLCLVLAFHPHSGFPAIGLIGALFFYPTNMVIGLLPITNPYSAARAAQSASWWPFSAFSS